MHDPAFGPAFAHDSAARLIFWISFAAWVAVELGVWARDRRQVSGAREDRGSVAAISLSITAALFCAFSATRIGAARIDAPAHLLAALGGAIVFAGLAFRLWAVRTLGRFFRVTVTVQDDHRLVEVGPYRLLRNPAYSGAMLTLAGIGVGIGNWLSLAALIALPLIGFGLRIRVEEASLARRFGEDFERYRSRRWALIPFLW